MRTSNDGFIDMLFVNTTPQFWIVWTKSCVV